MRNDIFGFMPIWKDTRWIKKKKDIFKLSILLHQIVYIYERLLMVIIFQISLYVKNISQCLDGVS